MLAVASGIESTDPTDEDRMALSCYARAMDHVGVMSEDPVFRWADRVVLDLHFDALDFQPGRYRRGGIEVTSPDGGPPAYVGPPAEQVPAADGRRSWPGSTTAIPTPTWSCVRRWPTCMSSPSIHFETATRESHGSSSLWCSRAGGCWPPSSSRSRNTWAATRRRITPRCRRCRAGSFQPERDATPFVRLCVTAHVAQARRRLRQLVEAGARWAYLETLVEQRDWPDRVVIALEQSLFQGTDRTAYVAEAAVFGAHGEQRSAAPAGRWADQPARKGAGHTLRRKRAAWLATCAPISIGDHP